MGVFVGVSVGVFVGGVNREDSEKIHPSDKRAMADDIVSVHVVCPVGHLRNVAQKLPRSLPEPRVEHGDAHAAAAVAETP